MPKKLANVAPLPGRTFIRFDRVSEKTGLPLSSLYDLVAKGEFPEPVPLSERRVAWLLDEVEAWIEARIAARDQPSEGRRHWLQQMEQRIAKKPDQQPALPAPVPLARVSMREGPPARRQSEQTDE